MQRTPRQETTFARDVGAMARAFASSLSHLRTINHAARSAILDPDIMKDMMLRMKKNGNLNECNRWNSMMRIREIGHTLAAFALYEAYADSLDELTLHPDAEPPAPVTAASRQLTRHTAAVVMGAVFAHLFATPHAEIANRIAQVHDFKEQVLGATDRRAGNALLPQLTLMLVSIESIRSFPDWQRDQMYDALAHHARSRTTIRTPAPTSGPFLASEYQTTQTWVIPIL